MLSFAAELWSFLRARKKFWMLPILLVMAVIGGLVVLRWVGPVVLKVLARPPAQPAAVPATAPAAPQPQPQVQPQAQPEPEPVGMYNQGYDFGLN